MFREHIRPLRAVDDECAYGRGRAALDDRRDDGDEEVARIQVSGVELRFEHAGSRPQRST